MGMSAIGAGLAAVGAGIGIGLAAWGALNGLARQPGMAGKLQTAMVIAAAPLGGVPLLAVVGAFLR